MYIFCIILNCETRFVNLEYAHSLALALKQTSGTHALRGASGLRVDYGGAWELTGPDVAFCTRGVFSPLLLGGCVSRLHSIHA